MSTANTGRISARGLILMRDEHSNKNANAQRQAAYAERQRALGRKKYSYWLRPEEAEKVAKLLENLRLEKSISETETGNRFQNT